jgi:hypothetical protein
MVGDFLRPPEADHLDAEKDMLENNFENYVFFNWNETWLLQQVIGILDDSLTGPDANGKVGLNDVIKNALNSDNKIKIDVNTTLISNLTNVVTGEAAHLDLISLELGGLDTFTKFDPIRPISNHTLATAISIENLTMTMNFMITMSDREYHDDISGSVSVDFGLNDVSFDLAVLIALIEDEFLGIKLGSLLDASIDPEYRSQFTDAAWNATKYVVRASVLLTSTRTSLSALGVVLEHQIHSNSILISQ